MDDLINQLQLKMPDEPIEEIERDVTLLRSQGVPDEEILSKVDNHFQTQGAAPAVSRETIDQPQTSVQPDVAKYIMGSQGGGAKTAMSAPDSRQLMYEKLNKPNTGQLIAEAFAGLGDSIASSYGGVKNNAMERSQKIRTGAAESAMAQFDKQITDKKTQREQSIQAKEDDPNSDVSKLYRSMMANLTGEPIETYANNPATELKPMIAEFVKVKNVQESSDSRSSAREATQEEREKRREERLSKNISGLLDRFNADPSVKKSQQSLDSANMIRDLAISGNPIGASAIPTYSARMSGEVGNLSEADKKPFGGSQAVIKKVEAALKQMATGRLSDDNKRFIIELSEIVEKRAGKNLDNLARVRAKQYSRVEGYGTENELYNTLRPVEIVNTNSSTGMTPDKKARLEELRAKKKAGTLQ